MIRLREGRLPGPQTYGTGNSRNAELPTHQVAEEIEALFEGLPFCEGNPISLAVVLAATMTDSDIIYLAMIYLSPTVGGGHGRELKPVVVFAWHDLAFRPDW